jgi:hypothetical protein
MIDIKIDADIVIPAYTRISTPQGRVLMYFRIAEKGLSSDLGRTISDFGFRIAGECVMAEGEQKGMRSKILQASARKSWRRSISIYLLITGLNPRAVKGSLPTCVGSK